MIMGDQAGLQHAAKKKPRNRNLDGLRGIAVLLVVAHHVSGSLVPFGGPVGVTLFFVLSGFLITRLLLKEEASRGRIDLRAFYIRRALRLYPALLLFLIALPLIMWATRDPQLGDYWWKGLAAAAYVTNLLQAGGQGFGILTHTWSLAVEEQFYLVWPAILIGAGLLARGNRRRLVGIVAGLLAVALAWRLAAMGALPAGRVYFAPDTNAFALLGGALLGSLPVVRNAPRWVTYAAVAVLGVLSVLRLPDDHQEAANTVAVLAAGVGLVAVWAAFSSAPTLLAWGPLVWVGTISYGLYLWHDALLKIEPAGVGATGATRVGIAALAVLVAWASFRWVERPILSRKERFERSTLV